MVKVRYLRVVFDGEIFSHEVEAFRGAIIDRVGRDAVLFHNHVGEQYRREYPLIQYKRMGKNPCIVCLGDGVDELHKLFSQKDWGVHIGEKYLPMKIKELVLEEQSVELTEQLRRYQIRAWLPISKNNYPMFQSADNADMQLDMLENKLIATILNFAKGIGWQVEGEIKCFIDSEPEIRWIKYKVPFLAFNLRFRTNVKLPPFIGLGKSAALGFGCINPVYARPFAL